MEMHWQLLILGGFVSFFVIAAIIGAVFDLDNRWG